MSISQRNSGYALELLVGIQDEFSNQSVAIKKESQKLEAEVKNLQKTTGDITKFQKAQKALAELESQQMQNANAIEKHKAAMAKLDAQSKASGKEAKRLSTEIDNLHKVTGNISDYKKAQQALGDLEKQQLQSKVAVDKQKTAIAELKKEISKGTKHADLLAPELQALQQLEKQHRDITTSTRTTERQLRKLSTALSDVGVDLTDLATSEDKTRKAIDKHSLALSKLKKESANTSEFDKHQRELKALESQNKELTSSSNGYERQLRRLKSQLSETGVDLNDLSNEEAQLKTKIDKTNQALKEQTQTLNKLGDARSKMEGFGEVMGAVGGVAAGAAMLAYRGNDMQKHIQLYAARTGTDIETINSEEQKKFRTELINKYGVTSGEIFTTQALASQQGLSNEDAMELTSTTLEIREVYDHLDPQEIIRAAVNVSKSFGVSIREAQNRIMNTMQQAGDVNGDLLDSFAEYSPLLGDKITLDQYSAVLTAGRNAGVWNYDKLGDATKEIFQARFSDVDEFRKLVGHGDKAGTIDLIKDEKVRNNVYAAAHKMREAINKGEGQGDALGKFMVSLVPVMQSDKGVVKNILESAGGTLLSEDIGVKGVESLTDGLLNPDKYINRNYDVSKVAESAQTAIDKTNNAAMAAQSTLDASAAELIDSQSHLADKISELSESFTDFVIANPSAGYAALAAEVAAWGLAGSAVWKLAKSGIGSVIDIATGAGDGKNDAKKPSQKSRFKLPKVGGAASVLFGGGAALYGASLIPDFSPIAIDRASERDDRASFLGMTSSETGRIGIDQSLIPKKVGLMDVWDEWFGTSSPEVKAVEEMVSANPTQPSAPVSREAAVQVTYSPQIHIELVGASQEQAQALSVSLVDALRSATPELEQQLRDVMSDILQGTDYLDD